MITITYKLSEKGRKASLLTGGDGKEKQVLISDITPELLDRARVLEDGAALWSAEAAPSRYYIYDYVGGAKPHLDRAAARSIYFDEPQTVESLLTWVKVQEVEVAAEKAALEAELPARIATWEEKEAALAAQDAIENKKMELREIAEAAAKEAREAERLAWIEAHGSDYLRRATRLGYNCQRKYVTERAELEFPDYQVDFDKQAEWKSRSCPSETALDEVEVLIEAGHDAEVVWLTGVAPVEDEDGYPEPFESCEAIVIKDYLGKYDLLKVI